MNLFFYLNFLKKLTFAKIYNFFILYLSYIFSIISRKAIRYGMPVSISIEPTTSCNLHCPQCPTGINQLKRHKGNISLQLFQTIVNQSYKYLFNLFLYFQGEPFIYPEIYKLIEYANSKNIFTATSTNGHYLSKENCELIVKSNLDKLIISLDGTSQKVYEKYRIGGNLKTVIAGIKTLIETKKKLKSKTPFIELQFLVLRTNEHQIEEIKKLSKELKINKLSLKSAQIYNFENDNIFIPENKKYSRYKKINKQWILKKKLKNKCSRLWISSVITWDGKVLPCCFDKDAKYSFGNIKGRKFREIIKNNNFKYFANNLLNNRKDIDICRNCSE